MEKAATDNLQNNLNSTIISVNTLVDDYLTELNNLRTHLELCSNEKSTYENMLKLNHLYLSVSAKYTELTNAIKQFHSPGGEGFKMCKLMLSKFFECKTILSNFTSVGDILYETVMCVQDEFGEIKPESLKNNKLNNFKFTQLSDYLINFVGQELLTTKALTSMVNRGRAPLVAAHCTLCEATVNKMLESDSKKLRDEGRCLYETYLNPHNCDCNNQDLAKKLNVSRRTYSNLKNSAITDFSKEFWGTDCLKDGLAELKYNTETKVIEFDTIKNNN